MSTPVSAKPWQSGIRSEVRLAAITAATSATASTSPLAIRPDWDALKCGCLHANATAGDGQAFAVLLAADVDHAGAAGRRKMGQVLRFVHGGSSAGKVAPVARCWHCRAAGGKDLIDLQNGGAGSGAFIRRYRTSRCVFRLLALPSPRGAAPSNGPGVRARCRRSVQPGQHRRRRGVRIAQIDTGRGKQAGVESSIGR